MQSLQWNFCCKSTSASLVHLVFVCRNVFPTLWMLWIFEVPQSQVSWISLQSAVHPSFLLYGSGWCCITVPVLCPSSTSHCAAFVTSRHTSDEWLWLSFLPHFPFWLLQETLEHPISISKNKSTLSALWRCQLFCVTTAWKKISTHDKAMESTAKFVPSCFAWFAGFSSAPLNLLLMFQTQLQESVQPFLGDKFGFL